MTVHEQRVAQAASFFEAIVAAQATQPERIDWRSVRDNAQALADLADVAMQAETQREGTQ